MGNRSYEQRVESARAKLVKKLTKANKLARYESNGGEPVRPRSCLTEDDILNHKEAALESALVLQNIVSGANFDCTQRECLNQVEELLEGLSGSADVLEMEREVTNLVVEGDEPGRTRSCLTQSDILYHEETARN